MEAVLTDPRVDAALLERAARGDDSAFADLYDRHSSIAFGVAMRILKDRTIAEDAVHDAFLTIWRQAARFDASRGSLRSWLLTVVRNRSIDILRHEQHSIAVEDMQTVIHQPDSSEPLTDVLQTLERDEIRAALAAIPAEQRSAIELAFFAGMTHVEIAERLGLPLGTVKGRIRMALQKLRGSLLAPTSEVAP